MAEDTYERQSGTSEREETGDVWESQRRGEVVDYAGEKERLRREVSHISETVRCLDRDNMSVAGVSLAGRLTVATSAFLDDPGIEPTNNRA